MIDLIRDRADEIAELCRRYRVERLDLFGSAAVGGFDPAVSDLGFVVEFEDPRALGILERYLDIAAALEQLFGRHVDLLTPRSIRNPFFKRTLEASRETIYDRTHRPAAA